MRLVSLLGGKMTEEKSQEELKAPMKAMGTAIVGLMESGLSFDQSLTVVKELWLKHAAEVKPDVNFGIMQ
jgi:hypothetical protein